MPKRAEKSQATFDPFDKEASENGYTAIAFIYLVPIWKMGIVACTAGESRIVVAKNSGVTTQPMMTAI